MAQVKSPLMSQDASGRMAGGLQIGHWMGRHVIGRRRSPRQPRTEAQLSTRIWQTWLSRQWAQLTPAEQLTWLDCPNPNNLTSYNLFVQSNTNLYKGLHSAPATSDKSAHMPAAAWPPTRNDTPANGSSWVLQSGDGWAKFGITLNPLNDNWVLFWNHVLGPADNATFRNLIAAQETLVPGPFSITITDLPAGPYRVAFQILSRAGKPNLYYRPMGVIVT